MSTLVEVIARAAVEACEVRFTPAALYRIEIEVRNAYGSSTWTASTRGSPVDLDLNLAACIVLALQRLPIPPSMASESSVGVGNGVWVDSFGFTHEPPAKPPEKTEHDKMKDFFNTPSSQWQAKTE